MDNAEQNRILAEAVEKMLAAKEAAVAAMVPILKSGMEMIYAKGRKMERRTARLLTFMEADAILIIKDGRTVTETPLERVIEILEPWEIPDESDGAQDADEPGEEPPFGHVSEFDTN